MQHPRPERSLSILKSYSGLNNYSSHLTHAAVTFLGFIWAPEEHLKPVAATRHHLIMKEEQVQQN